MLLKLINYKLLFIILNLLILTNIICLSKLFTYWIVHLELSPVFTVINKFFTILKIQGSCLKLHD